MKKFEWKDRPHCAAALMFIVALVLGVAPLYAGEARRGWTKLELSPLDKGKPGQVPPGWLHAFGAETVSEYASFTIVYAPDGAVDALTRSARGKGVLVRPRPELDVLQLPNATLDVRIGIAGAPSDGLSRGYAPGRTGLFLIQLAGPVRAEWIAQLHAIGWKLVRYIPNDGYIAVGNRDWTAATKRLSFIQWMDVYHPYQKYSMFAHDDSPRPMIFELPAGPGLEHAISEIRAYSTVEVRVATNALDTLVYATTSAKDARKLLHHELIIGVGPESEGKVSDERQVMSLTSNLNAEGSRPTSPKQYSAWLEASTRCPLCATMDASVWKVGVADYGLDDGNVNGGHPDLAGRKSFGLPDTDYYECQAFGFPHGCDRNYHGTFVAGIAVGGVLTGNTTRPVDADDYYLGTGVAPRAGVHMSAFRLLRNDKLLDYTADAIANKVTIQNHSFNEYAQDPDTSGTYTNMARTYDIAVRDATVGPVIIDGVSSDERHPLFITVSAGNNDQNSGVNRYYVSAGGTAKNVMSVSGTESYRGVLCKGCNSDSYRNIMKNSRVGTQIANYIKPDVMAPASAIISAWSSAMSGTSSAADCNIESETQYYARSGTSYAAPVAAGAAIIVKRYLGTSPAATSPALTKAMLIAGARSIRGGEDRTRTTVTTIGAVPSVQQGFGRLSFEDIITGATPPVTYDQDDLPLFTETGTRIRGRFRVRDGAKPVKVVLTWSDSPGTTGSPNPLVNDLNLEVVPPGSTSMIYVGNGLSVTNESRGEESTPHASNQQVTRDNVNNVEYARFFGNANQEFDVVIVAANVAGDVDGVTATAEQDFALVLVNADVVTAPDWDDDPPAAPQNLLAMATGTTVDISWNAVAGATGYIVERRTETTWAALPATSSTTIQDVPSSASGVVLYRVSAVNGSLQGAFSNTDVAFVGTFTDGTILTVPVTTAKAQHITEIRSAVNALRIVGGSTAIYSPAEIDHLQVQEEDIDAADWTSLMNNLSAARTAAGMSTGWSFRAAVPGVIDPPPAEDGPISRTHLEDLRRGLQ